jgi:hypothetical protein
MPLTKDFYIDKLEKISLNLNIIIKQRKEQELKRKEKYKLVDLDGATHE